MFGTGGLSRSEMMHEGDAMLAWLNLVQKFALSTKAHKGNKAFVESKQDIILFDPDKWIQGSETLRRRLETLGHKISEVSIFSITYLKNMRQLWNSSKMNKRWKQPH
jgi:hypothetical protein